MNVTIITPPAFFPITLAAVYSHLRLTPDTAAVDAFADPVVYVDTHPDDAMLTGFIGTATRQVELMARRSLLQQTLRLSSPGFSAPSCATTLPRPPLIRVMSVSYFDGSNAPAAILPGDYYVSDDEAPQLRFLVGYVVPSHYVRPDALRVEYQAGYAPAGSPPTTQAEFAANVPQPLKDAILLGVQLLYDQIDPAQREAIERMREALVQPYRVQLAL